MKGDSGAALVDERNESNQEMCDPFGEFSDDAPVENGMVALPEIPCVGFETTLDLIDRTRYLIDLVRRS